jgi:hypothetical protein
MSRLRRLSDAFRGDPSERFRLLRRVARWLLPNYRLTWPQIGWWNNEAFTAYLQRFGEADGMNSHRRWTLGQLMRLVDAVPGDTAECGVYQGAGSYLMAWVNQQSAQLRRHYLFDSFEGLSAPGQADGDYWSVGDLSASEDVVERNLSAFDAVELRKGWIPDCFAGLEDNRFAFVHIDVDLHDPTHDSLAFFYPRMNPGGIILCDDYGFTTCPGATEAMDSFFSDKPERTISLCAGSGFIIKGQQTQDLSMHPLT